MTEETEVKATMPPPPAPPRSTKVEKPASTGALILMHGIYPLQDPETGIVFREQEQVKVPHITTWMQYQIDAGLMTVVE